MTADLTEQALLDLLKEARRRSSNPIAFRPTLMIFTADSLRKHFGWTDEDIRRAFDGDGLPVVNGDCVE